MLKTLVSGLFAVLFKVAATLDQFCHLSQSTKATITITDSFQDHINDTYYYYNLLCLNLLDSKSFMHSVIVMGTVTVVVVLLRFLKEIATLIEERLVIPFIYYKYSVVCAANNQLSL